MMMMMMHTIETEGCNHDLNGLVQLTVDPVLNIQLLALGCQITKFYITILVLLLFYEFSYNVNANHLSVKIILNMREVVQYEEVSPHILIICALMIKKETDVFHCPILVAN